MTGSVGRTIEIHCSNLKNDLVVQLNKSVEKIRNKFCSCLYSFNDLILNFNSSVLNFFIKFYHMSHLSIVWQLKRVYMTMS